MVIVYSYITVLCVHIYIYIYPHISYISHQKRSPSVDLSMAHSDSTGR